MELNRGRDTGQCQGHGGVSMRRQGKGVGKNARGEWEGDLKTWGILSLSIVHKVGEPPGSGWTTTALIDDVRRSREWR